MEKKEDAHLAPSDWSHLSHPSESPEIMKQRKKLNEFMNYKIK